MTRSDTHDPADLAHLADDDRHRLLTAERRRFALEALSGRSRPVHLDDLAAAVAAREAETATAAPDHVERAAIALHHKHLPRLADQGVLEYDDDARQVH